MSRRVRTAVFPVAGLGTRFLPATKSMPKEMLTVVDKPLIQYAVEEAREAGIERLIMVTGRGKSALEDHFDESFELNATLRERGRDAALADLAKMIPGAGEVIYTRQQRPLGLGHAVWCAREVVGDEPFAVLLADDLILAERGCLAQMVDAHQKVGGNMLAVMEVAREHTSRYGIVSPGADDGQLVEVEGLVEKPKPEAAPSRLAVIGRYILEPEIFDHLSLMERGAGNEIQLTDAMAKMIGEMPFHGLRFAGRRFDCGDKAGFLEANIACALARPDMAPAVREFLPQYR
ncbi:UTP--glucose-1-phosphate uridylyltransferase [Stella humosa]|uniref:UTP--glucose-1-phosphate uridylyltransferase n=1 Tax=Stella humosa TaxID=94 RepID=A0A3N1KUM1_9PROT|nr:UTP--glucose-1-phosphate uridylyltransferase GalU [Stella humosa]ROP83694.1 UTP--glucose-1-phosphate uridylyltransferase [Stella humosa]BBK33034.1 UTP--glucose-1-phosphate uridylyltransferase [Stella humosa]